MMPREEKQQRFLLLMDTLHVGTWPPAHGIHLPDSSLRRWIMRLMRGPPESSAPPGPKGAPAAWHSAQAPGPRSPRRSKPTPGLAAGLVAGSGSGGGSGADHYCGARK